MSERTRFRVVPTALALLLAAVSGVLAQSPAPTVRVDSKTGYVVRIVEGALLDNGRSGWSPKGSFEQRLYRLEGVGEIKIVATVKPQIVPKNAIVTDAYTYLDSDSATSSGSAVIRTYYLPTRSVRIELIPYGNRMRGIIEAREAIYATFRWKPGAESDRVDVDKP